MSVLEAGSDVPEFTLRREDGEPFTRDDLAGATTRPRVLSGGVQLGLHGPVPDPRRGARRLLPSRAPRCTGCRATSARARRRFASRVGVTIAMLSDFEPKGAATRAFGCYFDATGVANRALVIVGPDSAERSGRGRASIPASCRRQPHLRRPRVAPLPRSSAATAQRPRAARRRARHSRESVLRAAILAMSSVYRRHVPSCRAGRAEKRRLICWRIVSEIARSSQGPVAPEGPP